MKLLTSLFPLDILVGYYGSLRRLKREGGK